MTRYFVLLASVFAVPYLNACSFCGGNPAGRATVREEYQSAAAVVFGTLKNPQLGADPTTGTTEFHFTKLLKSHGVVEKRSIILLPRYIPIPTGETGDAVIFFADRKGAPDAVRAQSSNAAIAEYLSGVAKLNEKDSSARLAFAFKHLDSGDDMVSDDAFTEFAKATDAEILKAKAHLDATKLKLMLKNPKTPGGRLGVYALLLGLCGEKADAAVLAGMVNGKLTESLVSALGGILSGIILLDPEPGWKEVSKVLCEPQFPIGTKLGALSAVRYLQTTRPSESKSAIVAIYKGMLKDRDLADLVIEDLRRWKWWDLSAEILPLYGRPNYTARGMRNAILRYALTCPDATAKRFAAELRISDPALVKDIEERLKDLE